MTRNLSKSKLVMFRQCPKRMWLDIHQPELAQETASMTAIFQAGHTVGKIARTLYDPESQGTLVDLHQDGVGAALQKTQALLASRRPIFEAGFASGGAIAFNDVLLPVGASAWRMVEVKASGSVKDYQLEDVAIQCHVARQAGIRLSAAAIAHIDTQWVYPGDKDYRGLLREVDVSDAALDRTAEVSRWVSEAHAVAAAPQPPDVRMGRQCTNPFECSYLQHCGKSQPSAVLPVHWLPRTSSSELKAYLEDHQVADLAEVPQQLLNPLQLRVRDCTLSGAVYFDRAGARSDLAGHPLPGYFLDFESIGLAVPLWAGTRPFQQIPFQYSLHRVDRDGSATHDAFLDLSGSDPSRRLGQRLVDACRAPGPVFVYNSGFEGGRLADLAHRLPDLSDELLDIRGRLVDLYPIALRRYYHPGQEGSWSIKKLLAGLVPELSYKNLEGVADGGAAQQAYQEAIRPETSEERRRQLRDQLMAYCHLDTWAMVQIWKALSGADLDVVTPRANEA